MQLCLLRCVTMPLRYIHEEGSSAIPLLYKSRAGVLVARLRRYTCQVAVVLFIANRVQLRRRVVTLFVWSFDRMMGGSPRMEYVG